MNNNKYLQVLSLLIILLAFVLFFYWLFVFTFINPSNNISYTHLAYSLSQGKVNLIENISHLSHPSVYEDVILYEDKYYWHQGIVPALVLLPFIIIFKIFGLFFSQAFLQFLLVLVIFYLVYQIIKKNNFHKHDKIYLLAAFTLGSVFIAVSLINTSTWYAQIVALFFVLLGICEFYGKKRYYLIGIFFGLAALTRVTAGLGIVFFLFNIIFIDKKKNTTHDILSLMLPFVLICCGQLLYNLARFADIFESGYRLVINSSPGVIDQGYHRALSYGLFSFFHLPGNLYYFLIASPLPVFRDSISHVLAPPFLRANPWGMSVFVTSPYLIYLFFLKYKDQFSKILITTILIILFPILFYFGIGHWQFGYRYALDFWPWLFLLFIINYKNQKGSLSLPIKIIITFSCVFNIYLFYFSIINIS